MSNPTLYDAAEAETSRLYGRKPKDTLRLAVFAFLAVGAGVPLLIMVAELLGVVFGYRLVAPGADVIGIFMGLGVVTGLCVYGVMEWKIKTWERHCSSIFQRLREEQSRAEKPV